MYIKDGPNFFKLAENCCSQQFFEILCWFIWHRPCESRLHSGSKNVCLTNARKICLNYNLWQCAIRPIRQLIEGVSFEISLFHEKCLQMNQKKKLTKKIFRIPDPDFWSGLYNFRILKIFRIFWMYGAFLLK